MAPAPFIAFAAQNEKSAVEVPDLRNNAAVAIYLKSGVTISIKFDRAWGSLGRLKQEWESNPSDTKPRSYSYKSESETDGTLVVDFSQIVAVHQGKL